ncbi:hypothetical protein ACOMHN_053299 [Nucella lapillus]
MIKLILAVIVLLQPVMGLSALLEEQSAALSSLAAVARDAEVARNNSAGLLDGLGRILEGQAEIAQVISGEGDATRREVQRTGDFLERQLDKVIDKQKVILRSLARTEAVLDAGFAKALSNEQITQGLISEARTAVKVAAVTNAQGQANITAEVKRSQNAIQKDVANVFKRQGTILDRIASLTNSEEKKLERVLARQSDILAQVKTSQKAVQSDIQEANANEKQTQSLVRTAQTTIVKDLKNHQANQGQTQHLAKKCVAAATCELSEVDHALATLSSVAAAMEKTLLKGLVQVRQQQSQTQGLVTRAETNIVRNINKDFDQIDQVIKTIEKFVVAAKSKIKKHIQILEQNVKSTKASQSVSLKLLAKMAEVIHRLSLDLTKLSLKGCHLCLMFTQKRSSNTQNNIKPGVVWGLALSLTLLMVVREVQRAGDFLERQLDKVIDKKKVILRSLARTEAVLDAGFAKSLSNEQVTHELIGQARKAVIQAAVANARGQANITAEVKKSKKAIHKDVANVFKRQGTILDRIASLTKCEEKKLDRVLARQSDILAQVKTSQKAVQSDIQEANANEKQTEPGQDCSNNHSEKSQETPGKPRPNTTSGKEMCGCCYGENTPERSSSCFPTAVTDSGSCRQCKDEYC